MSQVNLPAQTKADSRLSSISRIRGKIQGFVIEDSANNIAFPIPRPILDTSKPLLNTLRREFNGVYGSELDVFPWHFVVEMDASADYVIHMLRPISQKFPADRDWYESQIKANGVDLDSDTKDFFKNRKDKETDQMIHILIIGDSNLDVYARDIYKKIGAYIIGPLSRLNFLSPVANIFPLNMGPKFNLKALITASTSGA